MWRTYSHLTGFASSKNTCQRSTTEYSVNGSFEQTSKSQVASSLECSASIIIDISSSNQIVDNAIYSNKDPLNVNWLTQIRTSRHVGEYQLFDGKGQPFIGAYYKPLRPHISLLWQWGQRVEYFCTSQGTKIVALGAPTRKPEGGMWSGTLMSPL